MELIEIFKEEWAKFDTKNKYNNGEKMIAWLMCKNIGLRYKNIGQAVFNGKEAAMACIYDVEEILGTDLLDVGFDNYDTSLEIYPLYNDALDISDAQVKALLDLGFNRFWINYKNGTEQYSCVVNPTISKRRDTWPSNSWRACSRNEEVKRGERPLVFP